MKSPPFKPPIPFCEECKSRLKSVFAELKPNQMEALSGNKCGNIYKKGQLVFLEGNRPAGLFCICSGKVKVYKVGVDGKEQILRLAKDGEIVGYRSLMSGELYQASASVLEDSAICFIPKNVFFGLIHNDEELSMRIVRLISGDLRRAEKRISDMAQKTVRERLAETLIMLKEFSGCEKDRVTLSIHLTRDDLANIVGAATETTIRLLTEFKENRLIDLRGRKIKILNQKKLVDIAKMYD